MESATSGGLRLLQALAWGGAAISMMLAVVYLFGLLKMRSKNATPIRHLTSGHHEVSATLSDAGVITDPFSGAPAVLVHYRLKRSGFSDETGRLGNSVVIRDASGSARLQLPASGIIFHRHHRFRWQRHDLPARVEEFLQERGLSLGNDGDLMAQVAHVEPGSPVYLFGDMVVRDLPEPAAEGYRDMPIRTELSKRPDSSGVLEIHFSDEAKAQRLTLGCLIGTLVTAAICGALAFALR